MNDFLNIYNPNHAFQLTQEQIEAMQTLTDEQIKELASRYPNTGHSSAYLVLKDTSAKHQIYPASTWQNLYNLRVKNERKNYIAYTFKSLFIKTRSNNDIPVSDKVQDLTQSEIETAPGISRVDRLRTLSIQADKDLENSQQSFNQELDEFPDLTAEVVKKKPGRKPTIK